MASMRPSGPLRAPRRLLSLLVLCACLALFHATGAAAPARQIQTDTFRAGRARRDITGPAGQINMMGYANPMQSTGGLDSRLYARAFVFQGANSDANYVGPSLEMRARAAAAAAAAAAATDSDGRDPFSSHARDIPEEHRRRANVQSRPQDTQYGKAPTGDPHLAAVALMDIAFVTENLVFGVLDELQRIFAARGQVSPYDVTNILLAGTHTHSGPGGYAQYVLFQMTSAGFVEDSYWAIVLGTAEAIVAAHDDLQAAEILATKGHPNPGDGLIGRNRSPTSYLENPQSERDRYPGDTDTEMSLLRVRSVPTGNAKPVDLGLMNWFAVHPTSRNNTNTLISGDNKGFASYLFEQAMAPPGGSADAGTESPFVAAFLNSNMGDISPNIEGAQCYDGPAAGDFCDPLHSTCPNNRGLQRSQFCHGVGPSGRDDRLNSRIIGERQYLLAKRLFGQAANIGNGGWRVAGGSFGSQAEVESRMMFIRFSDRRVLSDPTNLPPLRKPVEVELCKPAMGYSFAAGTTDGPGMFNFYQGQKRGSPFWNWVRNFLRVPSSKLVRCQRPKPILLATGEATLPHAWQADIVPVQLLRIGDLAIAALPGEFTTMAGRRLRESVHKILIDGGVIGRNTGLTVVTGLASSYIDYITTQEEYQPQRYEAASNIFGEHTFAGYLSAFGQLADAMVTNSTVPVGEWPPDLRGKLITRFSPKLSPDVLPTGVDFGDLVSGPEARIRVGDTVEAVFWGANPRNDHRRGRTFLRIEQKLGSGTWQTVRTDADWDTELEWLPQKKDNSRGGGGGGAGAGGNADEADGSDAGLPFVQGMDEPDEYIWASDSLRPSMEDIPEEDLVEEYRWMGQHLSFGRGTALGVSPGQPHCNAKKTLTSQVAIRWRTAGNGSSVAPSTPKPGVYRIVYTGDRLHSDCKTVSSFSGVSPEFQLYV
ncbi:hypothetical protein H696_03371 [Fonticula alba]|uniref:Neutral ceramidase n=1 Tax=Fonticula alba TaxID=691883 RepID=A0A058Z6J8_FONAL|nr:hypothetical protein H696_03371 [Fonticula alba]KCV69904.1 hypothetical protein H696_03371 [Fonticula alba]|eukprot:XP_009495510.1 hypothetical protein H696_03371 [Fonticula alba]